MKYVTFSYDDNSYLNEKLLEILNRYHAKCTFNLNSGMIVPGKIASFFLGSRKMISLNNLKEMLSNSDHEIASHGEKHLNLLKLTDKEMHDNIVHDKDALEKIFNKKIYGFIYPYGAYSLKTTEELRKNNFHYSRTTVSTHSFDVPTDFLVWNPTCHHNDKELFNLAKKFVESKEERDLIFYIWGYAWEYGVFKNWNRLVDLLEILKKDPSIQYLTNEEVYKKIRGI